MLEQRFDVVAESGSRGRLLVPIPFDPDQVWQPKPRHHVTGTVNGIRIRAVLTEVGGRRGLLLGAAWLRDHPIAPGDRLQVSVAPEGPQRDDLPDDFAAALDAHPQAGAFFDALAQFYRRAYLRWIEGAARRPPLRAARIREVVELLAAGVKQRPQN